jgi:hypothetical protein
MHKLAAPSTTHQGFASRPKRRGDEGTSILNRGINNGLGSSIAKPVKHGPRWQPSSQVDRIGPKNSRSAAHSSAS